MEESNGLYSEIYGNEITTFRAEDISENTTRCNLRSHGWFLQAHLYIIMLVSFLSYSLVVGYSNSSNNSGRKTRRTEHQQWLPLSSRTPASVVCRWSVVPPWPCWSTSKPGHPRRQERQKCTMANVPIAFEQTVYSSPPRFSYSPLDLV